MKYHFFVLLFCSALATTILCSAQQSAFGNRAAVGSGWPETIWVEAETLGPLRGSNFSFQQEAQQTPGSWSLSGPGVAAEWTQGGESEFMSIAARADEVAGVSVGRDIEVPVVGQYVLWVRYADYRGKQEEFGVRMRQGGKSQEHVFGRTPVVDELDPMKLFWNWAFGWDSTTVMLEKGPAHLELYTTGPTGARRQVDCLCLTMDRAYRPTGRQKPTFAAWGPLRAMQQAGMPDVTPLQTGVPNFMAPKTWNITTGPPAFLWNVRDPWLSGLKKPVAERIEAPYGVDSALLNDFMAAFHGKEPPLYSHPLSGPALYIPDYPAAFTTGSPVISWLDRHPQSRFTILLNYGDPSWAAGADRAAVYANFHRYQNRFVGFVSGEAVIHGKIDDAALEKRVRAATSRAEVLAALRDVYSNAVVKKFSDYYGRPIDARDAWGPVISCLSANMEAYAHALGAWGERRLGHEGTGNSPTLARRLAFLRGASRQFGTQFVDYQSANLGDASMTLARADLFYPASSRYILDNQYDAWSGAGINWVLKDYLLYHLAGADAFYHEEGHDLFWKPGGGAAGDSFPVQLSPRGRVTEPILQLAQTYPRGTQFTPVAFLLDEAHGWSQERFTPGSFGLDPQWNPMVLTPGRHEAGIRGWLDIAYYPAPETQNSPADGIRQTYVNGIFGDIFDVIVTAPQHSAIASTYSTLIAAGEVSLSVEWGKALRAQVQAGGTLVVCADQFQGPGVKELDLPAMGVLHEASGFTWNFGSTLVPSNTFRYCALTVTNNDRVLATVSDGTPLCVARRMGKGQIIVVGAPLGLGIDERPIPLLGLLLRHLTQRLMPVQVSGDVEWTANRLEDGGWLIALLNNRGVIKPQHGILPVDHTEAQKVTLHSAFRVDKSKEWMTKEGLSWTLNGSGATLILTVPAGGVRLVEIHSK